MSLNSTENNNEQQIKIEEMPLSNDNQVDIPMTMS
jgi:hypothetical protein